ncbi:hypothetical protein [Streptomyces sp. NPDC058086]|uniref:hypothetical protein n=1 Tax=Streptomyces sp. NPDC058086 TaxID=3346334 RepID=UPI0036E2BC8B
MAATAYSTLTEVGCEVVACLAGCVELGEESECLPAHRFLDQGGLAEPALVEHFEQPVGLGVDATLTPGFGDGGPQPSSGQPGGLGRSGCDRQDRAGLPGQQPLALYCERLEDRGIVLAQV